MTSKNDWRLKPVKEEKYETVKVRTGRNPEFDI